MVGKEKTLWQRGAFLVNILRVKDSIQLPSIHPSTSTYLDSGHRGTGLGRKVRTFLSPASYSSLGGRLPRPVKKYNPSSMFRVYFYSFIYLFIEILLVCILHFWPQLIKYIEFTLLTLTLLDRNSYIFFLPCMSFIVLMVNGKWLALI